MLNILMSSLPESVVISGREYPINWDFKVGIRYEEVIRSTDISDEEKIWKALRLFYIDIPMDIQGAIVQMQWFYRCGKPTEEKDQKKQRYQQKSSSEPAYAFLQDAPYIFADFKSQYGMDIVDQDKPLHWWKFSALFESLGEKTKMGEIMYYRKVRTSGMPKERRAFINDMKRLYQISDGSSGRKRLSLEERNESWKDYVKSRREAI